MTMSASLHAGCAAFYTALALLAILRRQHKATDLILGISCIVTAAWSAAAAVYGGSSTRGFPGTLELARSIAWYVFVLYLYNRSVLGNDRMRHLFGGVGLLTALVVGLSLADAGAALLQGDAAISFASVSLDARLGLAVCSILLIENLYRNAPADLRWHVALPCIAVGMLSIYDVLLYGDAILFRRLSPILSDGRAVVTVLVAPLLALSGARNRRRWGTIHVSRKVVFHTASLVVIGIFLLALAATGEVLRQLASEQQGDWGEVLEVGLVAGGVLVAGVFVTSGSARSSLRSLVVDNFFTQRYDYRVEWLRCIGTLSQLSGGAALHLRVIRAVAQVVDSPAGLLFLKEPEGRVYRWAGSWNMPPATSDMTADTPLVGQFRQGDWVVEARGGGGWIDGAADLWLAVPLNHAGRLTGFTLLAKPRAPFTLDREVFDLLRSVGQECASHVAEQQAAETLLQTRQLREYGEKFAFVAHDIKNVASQLSLLLANAEHHIDNPDFQRDMLVTVGASVHKITALLARLKNPEEPAVKPYLSPAKRIARIVAARAPSQRDRVCVGFGGREHYAGSSEPPYTNVCELPQDVVINIAPEGFDAVIAHLLDNSFEASPPDTIVTIELRQVDKRVEIYIVDQGTGMSPEFIRDQLFQPFSSSKSSGFGLGVYQAREILRGAGGDLQATSKPGSGTTMTLSLPVVDPQSFQPVARTTG